MWLFNLLYRIKFLRTDLHDVEELPDRWLAVGITSVRERLFDRFIVLRLPMYLCETKYEFYIDSEVSVFRQQVIVWRRYNYQTRGKWYWLEFPVGKPLQVTTAMELYDRSKS